jgi:hypothetical protein
MLRSRFCLACLLLLIVSICPMVIADDTPQLHKHDFGTVDEADLFGTVLVFEILRVNLWMKSYAKFRVVLAFTRSWYRSKSYPALLAKSFWN